MTAHTGRLGTPISLGDALLAASSLSPQDTAAREAILAALGFEHAPAPTADTRVGPWLDHDRVINPTPPTPQGPKLPHSAPRSAETDMPSPKIQGRAAALTDAGTVSLAAPPWATTPVDPFLAAAGDADSLPPPPLFPATRARAILSVVLATWRDGSQLDINSIVASLTTGRPLRRLPLLQVPTLRQGAQVLIDRSDAMAPFQADIDGLVADLQRLFARGHLQLLQFKHSPSRGVRVSGSRRRAWEPPSGGVPIVVVSDLGAGTPLEDDEFAAPSEWLAVAHQAAQVGSTIVAVTPFGPRRWPAILTRAMTFVHWSERTNARQAARALRESSHGRGKRHE